MAETISSKLAAILATAGHPTTDEPTALNALRKLYRALDQGGHKITDLRLKGPQEPSESRGGPDWRRLYELAAEQLEAAEKIMTGEREKLATSERSKQARTAENRRLKARIAELEGAVEFNALTQTLDRIREENKKLRASNAVLSAFKDRSFQPELEVIQLTHIAPKSLRDPSGLQVTQSTQRGWRALRNAADGLTLSAIRQVTGYSETGAKKFARRLESLYLLRRTVGPPATYHIGDQSLWSPEAAAFAAKL